MPRDAIQRLHRHQNHLEQHFNNHANKVYYRIKNEYHPATNNDAPRVRHRPDPCFVPVASGAIAQPPASRLDTYDDDHYHYINHHHESRHRRYSSDSASYRHHHQHHYPLDGPRSSEQYTFCSTVRLHADPCSRSHRHQTDTHIHFHTYTHTYTHPDLYLRPREGGRRRNRDDRDRVSRFEVDMDVSSRGGPRFLWP
ncbi:uncharacterized protein BO95DRAFT_250599 [Aspergillus brunneoviolaceus CBS 621.78]|uniref:Uncharacterized protein n=1 Tax=Aspergillus brunneoviolaceus CBS 621.78 TaxID=1450534 RepID=A0ACD1FYH9_9EURO|nr:hypothetical protein BO95DRAFT_250599 [Aspergillus brunneoviolaceus CBS 621.78]RAH42025.1 hypothetical protein BO95DRAFT_250599 [Aspergillus brunneoviolaceus CBS 621.78]